MLRQFLCLFALCLLAFSPAAMACPQCRPLVQAGIHTADFALTLGVLMLPLALILAVALAVYNS